MASITHDASATLPDEEMDAPELMTLPDLFEVIDGDVVELAPMGLDEGLLANELKRFLDAYLAQHPSGRALTEILFDLSPAVNRSRRPDAAFISFDRWPKGKRLGRGIAMPATPEIAAEVVSPGDGAAELLEKLHEYFSAGARLVWIVYPGVEQIYVYDSVATVRILGRADRLDGGAVLPGFQLPLAELFGPAEGNEETA
ncbi:Uma2 family endonuclease [Tautonia sp. JC769]|uniref:Uma2 family endonuclease n=1 Tax=Tautonia sp. JC769 TaxID=3232135 RepID=UPI003457BB0B